MKRKIFISAMEPSAEKHCAELIQSAKEKDSSIEFAGFGGRKMASAGCDILEDTVSRAAMIYNVLSQLGCYKKLISEAKRYLRRNRIGLVVVCDSPAFNFHIAKAAKKLGIPVMFYVAPQLWAWAPWRIRKLRKCCDKLCCILPFEEKWFKARGVDAEFVGNPLFDELDIHPRENTKNYENFTPESARICLLPGSRKAEIESLWEPMQEIGLKLKQKFPEAEFTAVGNNQSRIDMLKAKQINGFECRYETDSVISTCLKSDLCICASGSASLQAAAAGCPMIIMYQSSPMVWNLAGRFIIRLKHLSLPNILAGRGLVPEFMPYFKSTEPIAEAAENLLENPDKLKEISTELTSLTNQMTEIESRKKTAEIMLSMLN
ncbi:Lipid-A-disaccharide synthase [Sedimentisphaera cyanobacteriorum]|uniref:Lipid-A-disaccharide synthase n=1 Tax=Sedimentisphaera cyanobacteriorum TaxID=1940790 RepID=A0A1Q2HR01_9BACT|nr:lipid-A-disaccharide synthase [Sedimentisphaera cyanobacteriorum]AQQ09694.1 Lipid-A-disaccharide synthase [Sedimentisphaera cyanobacteriorum]